MLINSDYFKSLRSRKDSYKNISIDINNPLFNEPLVGIYEYQIVGQSYYSRYNAATNDPVNEVLPEPKLRLTVANKLAELNSLVINSKSLQDHFGGQVELFIQEGYRSPEVQKLLYEKTFPNLLKKQYPDITQKQIKEKLADLVAKPSVDPLAPSPHVTGGAFDLRLRYKQSNLQYVSGSQVKLSLKSADVSKVNYPDYFEDKKHIKNSEDEKLRKNRRVFYSVMTGEYFGIDTDFACNPTEWWHWSYGDQLWAYVNSKPSAIYSVAKY